MTTNPASTRPKRTVMELVVRESMQAHGWIAELPDLYQTGDLTELPLALALHASKFYGCDVVELDLRTRTTYWTGAVVEETYEWPGVEMFGYDLTDPIEFRLWSARAHHQAQEIRSHDRAVYVYLVEWDGGCRIVVPEVGLDRVGRRVEDSLSDVRFLMDLMAGIDYEDVDVIERTPFLVLDRDELVADLLAEPYELVDYASGAVPYTEAQASRLMDSMFRRDGLVTA